jgi:hypothetical protein
MPLLEENKVCASVPLFTLCLMFYFCCYTEIVGESTRAIRNNRGQGGHAYQLEKALNPITGDQVRKGNEGIPETVAENPMAPQALGKARSGKNGVNFVFYRLIVNNCQVIPRSKTQE